MPNKWLFQFDEFFFANCDSIKLEQKWKKKHSTNIETKRKCRTIQKSSFDSFRSQKYRLFNNHDISVFNLNSLENSNDLQIKRTNEWTIQTKCPWFSNEPNAFLFRLKKKNEIKQIRFYFYKAQHEFSSLAGYSLKKTQCKMMKNFTQNSFYMSNNNNNNNKMRTNWSAN